MSVFRRPDVEMIEYGPGVWHGRARGSDDVVKSVSPDAVLVMMWVHHCINAVDEQEAQGLATPDEISLRADLHRFVKRRESLFGWVDDIRVKIVKIVTIGRGFHRTVKRQPYVEIIKEHDGRFRGHRPEAFDGISAASISPEAVIVLLAATDCIDSIDEAENSGEAVFGGRRLRKDLDWLLERWSQ